MLDRAAGATRAALRGPFGVIVAGFALALAFGFTWGLPGSDSWSADSISPRSCGLGAIVEAYWPGHFQHYPPLHMAGLTLLSLPWMALAAARAGASVDALGAELIKPLYMTGIEVSARLVAAAMAVGILHHTRVLWTRLAGPRAGLAAAAVVAANAVLVYYGRTGNLDVPYLFWLTWSLVELDRVACGEPRETQTLLLATAAVLTKDQAAAAVLLPLPVYLAAVPWLARRAPPTRRGVARAVLVSAATFALVSGAVVNPVGFRRRLVHLFGPASKPWAQYPPGLGGAIDLARDALRTTTDFTSWPIAAAALAGVAIAVHRGPALTRARLLLPLLAAVSFAVFFSLQARQSEHRFFLPESVFLLPYAGLTFDLAWTRAPRWRPAVAGAAAISVAAALLGVASLDATLLTDSRYAAERFLARLPAGTHVEVYGGPIFLPRIPPGLVAVRPGVEPPGDRQAIPGVIDLVDPAMDPRPRAPDAIVLATELSDEAMARPSPWATPPATMQYRDARSHEFLRALYDGELGYDRALRATCSLPWPLECRDIHHSTGRETWIYLRRGREARAPGG